MSQVRVHNFTVSLDGFGTGEGQSLDAPFGHAQDRLHQWFFATRSFHAMQGAPGGDVGVDDAFASSWGPGVGAEIMGRNKFGPQRGPWADEQWKGWWGDNPPFHTPVFVLTHHPRPSIEMDGGTAFHFIDASPAEALDQARRAQPRRILLSKITAGGAKKIGQPHDPAGGCPAGPRSQTGPAAQLHRYRRVKVRWVTPLGLLTASVWKRSSSASSPSQSASPRPSTMGATTMCM